MNCAALSDPPKTYGTAWRESGASIAVLFFCLLLVAPAALGQSGVARARTAMEDPDNPLVRVDTARGEFFVELYPEAAPASVQWFLAVAGQQNGDTGEENTPGDGTAGPVSHYAGQTFDRILPGVLIQSSGPSIDDLPAPLAARAPAPEINATILGLEQQPLLESDGGVHPWLNIADREQFEQQILIPLYRELGITGPAALAERSDEVTERLRASTVADVYRRQGYRHTRELPSRSPRTGSLLLLAATPQRSSATITVTLTDTPWLRGQHTVIGHVVDGMPVVRALGSQPRRGTPPATIYRIETASQEDGS